MDTALPTLGYMIWRWAELYGINARKLFEKQGIDEQDIRPDGQRIAMDKFDSVLSEAVNHIEEDCSGLKVSRCWHPSDLGTLGYAWLASSTIRTAVERISRYWKILGERASLESEDTDKGLRITVHQKPRDLLVRELVADMLMSLLLDMCRFNFGASLRPVDVTLLRNPPDCISEYTDFFGGDVNFSARQDSFTLALEDADKLLPTSNRKLAGVHDKILVEQLSSLDENDLVSRCKTIILDNLTSGDVKIEEVARELHLSTRTLMRRLASQGSSMKILIDEARSDLAKCYLADPSKSIVEIAFLLGFSQQSSMTRASKRWFGMPPKEYRSNVLGCQ